jgi:hypothetical protein
VRRAAFRRTSSFSEKESSMEANGSVTNGVSTGLALGATVGVGYAACALVFRLWPEEADMLSQYRRCMQSVPAFVPKPGHPSTMKGDFT